MTFGNLEADSRLTSFVGLVGLRLLLLLLKLKPFDAPPGKEVFSARVSLSPPYYLFLNKKMKRKANKRTKHL